LSPQIQGEISTTSLEKETNDKIEDPSVVEEKIITKTIMVDNPELQKRIDELLNENNTLKQQINSQSKSLNQMANDYNDAIGKYNSMINALPKFTTMVEEGILRPLADKYNACRTALGMVSISRPSLPAPVYYSPINHTINCISNSIGSTVYTSCH